MNDEEFDKVAEGLKSAGFPFVLVVSGEDENLYHCHVPSNGLEGQSENYELRRTLEICTGLLHEHMEKLAKHAEKLK